MMAAQSPRTRRSSAIDVETIRSDFPILNLKVNGKPLVFLDNAASSQMPQSVIDRLVRYQMPVLRCEKAKCWGWSERAAAGKLP